MDKECQLCRTPTIGEPNNIEYKDDDHRWENYTCTGCGHDYTIGMVGNRVSFIGGGVSLGELI